MPFGQQLNYQSEDDEIHNADLTDFRPPGVDPNSKIASDKPWMPCGHKLNARNLVVCIDGTSFQFETSVSVRLANIRPRTRRYQRSEHKR